MPSQFVNRPSKASPEYAKFPGLAPPEFTPPLTSSLAWGLVVPMPTLPPLRTSWLLPAIKPFAGRLSAPVIVSPDLAT